MTRIGPLVLSVGIGALCAGIISTRADIWKRPNPGELTMTLDMQGVQILEIGRRQLGELTIADRPALIHIHWWQRPDADYGTEPILRTRDGNRLRLDLPSEKLMPGKLTLEVPPGLELLSGRNLSVKADTNAGTLRIETFGLTWQGDAETLDIRARTWPSGECEARHERRTPAVSFVKGRAGRVRISIERGNVVLQDLSRVDRIELHAGPEVGLSIRHVEDLQRITLHPFDGEATLPPPDTGDDAAGANCNETSHYGFG